MRAFFTDGTHAVTTASLVDFLSYQYRQKKKKLHAGDDQKTLSDLMRSIRFVSPQGHAPKHTQTILNTLYQEYDQQNTLTARFLHHLRDV